MRKFMVLYQSSVSAGEQMANTTPEQAKAGMDLWMNWAQKAGNAIVDLGSPLGTAINVSPESVSTSVTQISGFSILQAESMDAVTKLLEEHPHFRMGADSSIEVLEFLPMPGT